MTKHVLQSGGIKRQPELKKQFHQEFVKGLGSNPQSLLCDFAQGREYWEPKLQNNSDAVTPTNDTLLSLINLPKTLLFKRKKLNRSNDLCGQSLRKSYENNPEKYLKGLNWPLENL